jgi:phosphoglycolate phosphatase-like HAD superfamily hydrolase
MRLILFDIDGTLLLTGHAGKRALRSALTSDPALAHAFDSVRMDGKTDPLIIREVMRACGREAECTQEAVTRFLDIYVENL